MFITNSIDYKTVNVDSNLRAYTDSNCIIDGGTFNFKLLEDNKTLEIIIDSGKYILDNKLIVLVNKYTLDINIEPYDDIGTIAILAHYTPCSHICGNQFQYRVGYISSDCLIIDPRYTLNDNTDIINISSTILLGTIKFKKQDNKIISVYDSTPKRNNIYSYFNNPEYCILNKLYKNLPFDRITSRICELVAGNTGGIGNTGQIGQPGLSGPIGKTGGSGGQGNTGNIGLPGTGHQYTHIQQKLSQIWYITHNLGIKYPMIQVFNFCSTNNKIITDYSINFINENYLVLTFEKEICGRAILLVGHSYNVDHNKQINKLPTVNNIDFPCITTGGTGDRGFTGLIGSTGPTGPVGVPGISGRDGIEGKEGCRGPSGMRGVKGDPGRPGPIGPTGSIGPIGTNGTNGFGIESEYIHSDKTNGIIKFKSGLQLIWNKGIDNKIVVEYIL